MFRAIVFVASLGLASAQPVRLSVTTPIVVHSIDDRIFGQSVTGGIWGEAVRNGKFAENAAHWRTIDGGIEQSGIVVRAGDTLRGTLRVSGDSQGVTVRLLDGKNVLASATGPALALTPSASSPAATLQVLLPPSSDLKVEEITLMPDSTRVTDGFHPDLLQALTALHPPILRWSAANWKTGTFGPDQFLALAQKLGSQPVIAIPASLTAPETQELVRYCDEHHVKYVDRGGLVTEWHATSALDAAAALLALLRDSKAAMAAPAPGAVIDFAQRPWKPTPAYAAMKLFRQRIGIDVLQMDGSDAVATRSADGRTIYVQAVNPKPTAIDLEVTLRGDFPLLTASLEILSNDATRPAPAPIENTGLAVRFRLPAFSIGVATLVR
jgi:hypothetical protein